MQIEFERRLTKREQHGLAKLLQGKKKSRGLAGQQLNTRGYSGGFLAPSHPIAQLETGAALKTWQATLCAMLRMLARSQVLAVEAQQVERVEHRFTAVT